MYNLWVLLKHVSCQSVSRTGFGKTRSSVPLYNQGPAVSSMWGHWCNVCNLSGVQALSRPQKIATPFSGWHSREAQDKEKLLKTIDFDFPHQGELQLQVTNTYVI